MSLKACSHRERESSVRPALCGRLTTSDQRAVGQTRPEVESTSETADSSKRRRLQRRESPEYRLAFDTNLLKGGTEGGSKGFLFLASAADLIKGKPRPPL